MSTKLKIEIYDSSDSFDIIIKRDDESFDRYHFDQEDNREKLKLVFEKLGFKTTYREVY